MVKFLLFLYPAKSKLAIIVNRRVQYAVLGCNLKNDRMISVHIQGKSFNIIIIQVYALTSNAEEAEVERFYEDLQDLLELTPPKKYPAQAGIKVAGRNINYLRYADDTTVMAESEEDLKSLLMKVKVESEKVGLKLNIQKMKIMASGPITSWEIDGETVSDFIFLGSKITADGDCSHEIKRRLVLGRKVMTNLDSILKSRDTTLPAKVRLVKAMVFPVVMYGCESWTVKKAEC